MPAKASLVPFMLKKVNLNCPLRWQVRMFLPQPSEWAVGPSGSCFPGACFSLQTLSNLPEVQRQECGRIPMGWWVTDLLMCKRKTQALRALEGCPSCRPDIIPVHFTWGFSFCTTSFSASLPMKAICYFDIISGRKPNQPFSFLDNICSAWLRADPPCPASHTAGFPKGCGTASSSSLSWCFSYLPGTEGCGKESDWLCHPPELTHTEVINLAIKSQPWAETWQRRFWGKVCVRDRI